MRPHTIKLFSHISFPFSKKLIAILFLAGCFVLPFTVEAQSGGRKREKTARRRGNFHLNRWKSMGHADEFARGSSGRRGRLARLFRRPRPAWSNRRSESPRKQWKANQFLFTRHRTPGKVENADYHFQRNRERSRMREHGNKTFKRRKYRRR